jgi:Terminase-like family.
VRIVPGGTSAGKTYGIIPILIDVATRQRLEISIVSESIPHLRKGAMRDFLKIMECTGRFISEHWNKSNFTYTFTNGSFIEFFSADKQSKVRGPRRDILYINECNAIDFETYYQLAIRTKK